MLLHDFLTSIVAVEKPVINLSAPLEMVSYLGGGGRLKIFSSSLVSCTFIVMSVDGQFLRNNYLLEIH